MKTIPEQDQKLCDELQQCVDHSGIMPMIRHPLVHTFFHGSPIEIEHANGMLKQKRERMKTTLAEGRFESWVYYHERPYRLEAFREIEEQISDAATWNSLLASIWTDTEFPSNSHDEWTELWERADPLLAMNSDERATFNLLPQRFVVYRGSWADNDDGISWTRDRESASFFATRFNDDGGRVWARTVNKSQCLVYLNGRGEQEIIIL